MHVGLRTMCGERGDEMRTRWTERSIHVVLQQALCKISLAHYIVPDVSPMATEWIARGNSSTNCSDSKG